MRDDRTHFLFVFRDEYLTTGSISGEREHKSVLTNVFADVDWECPQILAAIENVRGVYFDRVDQIRMDRWAKGRTALIGDAAACVSLAAGERTGLAMAEAYVLAGELHGCGNDHIAAFARYQERMMPFLKRKQESAAKLASSFAPGALSASRSATMSAGYCGFLWLPSFSSVAPCVTTSSSPTTGSD